MNRKKLVTAILSVSLATTALLPALPAREINYQVQAKSYSDMLEDTYNEASSFYQNNFDNFSVMEGERFYSVYQDAMNVLYSSKDEKEMKKANEALQNAIARAKASFLGDVVEDEDPEEVEEEYIAKIVSKGAVVRDMDGKKIGYLKKNTIFDCKSRKGKKVYIIVDGQKASVHRNFINFYGETKNYVSRGVNIRGTDGKVIYYSKPGTRFKAEDQGEKVMFVDTDKKTKKKRIAYANKNFIAEDIFTKNYISKGARVRDSKGKPIGYIKAGKAVKGSRSGKKIKILYKGKDASIHSNFVK